MSQIALQLFTLRRQLSEDFIGTLRQVAAIGYPAVEFAGYGGVPVDEIRSVLDECGLRAMGAHVPFEQLRENPQQAIEEAHALGCDFVIVPSVPGARRESIDHVRSLAATLNEWGGMLQGEGLRFGYHNHDFEFGPLDGHTMYDVLAAEIDPRRVRLEIDIYWAQFAGVDPRGLIRRYADRTSVLHVKDMVESADPSDAPVGTGILPLPEILSAAAGAGVEWYVVEQDEPEQPMADAEVSLRHLERLLNESTDESLPV